MNRLWIAKGKYEGEDVYLPHCVKKTRPALAEAILEQAKKEGFKGTIEERLKDLEWQLVEIEFTEVPNVELSGREEKL